MKTPERTDKTHEQPVYELKPIRGFVYCAAVLFLFVNGFLWWLIPFSQLIKESVPEIAIALGVLAIFLLPFIIMCIAAISGCGDVYFYEGYVERQALFPFAKRKVIYYDKMHVHIAKPPDWVLAERAPSVIFNHCEMLPKHWLHSWLEEYHSENIIGLPYPSFGMFYDPKILEFVKTKAQSVSYYNPKWEKLN